MEEKKDYEDIQLSNIWIKEHIFDIISKINQYEIIAKVGCSDLNFLSQMSIFEIEKEKLNGLKLMEAEIENLKSNGWFKFSQSRRLHIKILLKQSQRIEDLFEYINPDLLNEMVFELTDNFYWKLDFLQSLKETLIDGCAEAGWFMPKKDEDLEEKTSKDLEDEDGS